MKVYIERAVNSEEKEGVVLDKLRDSLAITMEDMFPAGADPSERIYNIFVTIETNIEDPEPTEGPWRTTP